MSTTHPHVLGSTEITNRQLRRSLLIAAAPTAFVIFVLRDAPWYVSIPAGLIAFGFSAGGIFKTIDNNRQQVEQGHIAALLSRGSMTGEYVGPGDYPLFPGDLESLLDVNMKEQTLDPPVFEELAKDKVPVYVDGYLIAKVIDPDLFLTIPEHGMDTLSKLFESEVRKFVSQWNRASDVIVLRDLLSEFLELPGNEHSSPEAEKAYRKFREKLAPLVGTADDSKLTPEAFTNIMEAAGTFCGDVNHWGICVTEIHLEQVDLPARIKIAAETKAAAKDSLGAYEIRQAKRLEMAKELKAEFPNLPDVDVMNLVDQLLQIPVNRKIEDIRISGLGEITNLNPDAARFLQGLVNRNRSDKQ